MGSSGKQMGGCVRALVLAMGTASCALSASASIVGVRRGDDASATPDVSASDASITHLMLDRDAAFDGAPRNDLPAPNDAPVVDVSAAPDATDVAAMPDASDVLDVVDVADANDVGDVNDVNDASEVSDGSPDVALDVGVPDAREPGACGPCGAVCPAGDVCVADRCVPGPDGAVRPLWPPSMARVASNRPTLRWRLPQGVTAARVQLCRDRACEREVRAAVVTGDAFPVPEALARGVYFWRVFARRDGVEATAPSATWEFSVRARSAPIDTAQGTFVDFDGDGYSDVIVSAGAPPTTAIYHGGPEGTPVRPTAMLPLRSDGTPARVQSVGDLNGDGYTDLLGSEEVGGVRRRVLYPGGPRGVTTTPVLLRASDPWPAGLSNVGDLDGDGYLDLAGPDDGTTGPANQIRVFFGASDGVRPRSRVLITAAQAGVTGLVGSSGGDVNGDRRPDLAFGEPAAADGAGRAIVWVNDGGCADGHLVTLPGETAMFAHFGDSLSIVGDFDADGYADVSVAAPFDADSVDRSAIWVFPGGGGGPDTARPLRVAIEGRQVESIRLSSGGDVNGDGYVDLVAWMHLQSTPPRAYLHFGSWAGLRPMASRILQSADYDPRTTAFSVGHAGDTDADGFDDLTVFLAPGQVVISRGAPAGPITGTLPMLGAP